MVSVTFTVPCPECGERVDDVEGWFTESRSWAGCERLGYGPVDESELEIESIPICPECRVVTLTDEVVSAWFWKWEAVSYA